MRAMKQAAAVQQREAGLMQQRKAWRQPLVSRDDIRAAAMAVANGWALPPVTGESPSIAFYVQLVSHMEPVLCTPFYNKLRRHRCC